MVVWDAHTGIPLRAPHDDPRADFAWRTPGWADGQSHLAMSLAPATVQGLHLREKGLVMQGAERWKFLDLAGCHVRYSVVGDGPVLVMPRKDRGEYLPAALMADTHRVLQIEPLGFGRSDRPDPYPPLSVPEQILAVCDAEGVDGFAVWGYSQGGAMACAVAQVTPRARAVVCGGFNVLRPPTPAWVARMNRERRVPLGSRAFWNYFTAFDWHHELQQLRAPMLSYAGTRDRQHPRRQDLLALRAIGVEVVEFDGLDHGACGLSSPDSPATSMVIDWLRTADRRG